MITLIKFLVKFAVILFLLIVIVGMAFVAYCLFKHRKEIEEDLQDMFTLR